ncbi:hypothetical protein HDV00_005337 [Rhizophlyctis rosea]|nr:hypothetical protein HDV00_005337 [Rhizophlyctis rosea]
MTCFDSKYLCPKGNGVCGAGACYDPKSYACSSGKVVQIAASASGSTGGVSSANNKATTSTSTSSTSSGSCGAGLVSCAGSCLDPANYHCDSGVVAQGPSWSSSLPAASILPSSTQTLGSGTRKITLINNCANPVWPGLLAQQQPLPGNGGFGLAKGQRVTLLVPNDWQAARIWGRTDCRVAAGGKVVCLTGHCGTKENGYGVECKGVGGQAPATLAEFTLAGWGGSDYYDISNVDGHNIGISIKPLGGTKVGGTLDDKFDCKSSSCSLDFSFCPPELRVYAPGSNSNPIACASISTAISLPSLRARTSSLAQIFANDELKSLVTCSCDCGAGCGCDDPRSKHCCSPYTPLSMQSPTRGGVCRVEDWPKYDGNKRYDQVFKSQCPQAYSWQFDDLNSTFQCKNTDYEVTFCPTGQVAAETGITRSSTTKPYTTRTTAKTTYRTTARATKTTTKTVGKTKTPASTKKPTTTTTTKKKKVVIIVKVVKKVKA